MYRKLRVTEGPLAGTEYLLGRSTTIGRSGNLEVQLLGKAVSREHARLEVDDDGKTMRLRDLGSKNGTYVDGVRIEEVVLRSGERFEVGNSSFLYEEFEGHVDVAEDVPMLAVVGGRADEVTSLFNSPFGDSPPPVRRDEPTLFPAANDQGGCQDPLHAAAKEKGWAFCPVCGAAP